MSKSQDAKAQVNFEAGLRRRGVLIVCRNLHLRVIGLYKWDEVRVIKEVQWLQDRLKDWREELNAAGKPCEFSLVTRKLIEATIAECAIRVAQHNSKE